MSFARIKSPFRHFLFVSIIPVHFPSFSPKTEEISKSFKKVFAKKRKTEKMEQLKSEKDLIEEQLEFWTSRRYLTEPKLSRSPKKSLLRPPCLYVCDDFAMDVVLHRSFYFAGENIVLYLLFDIPKKCFLEGISIEYIVKEMWFFRYAGKDKKFTEEYVKHTEKVWKGDNLARGLYSLRVVWKIPQECPGSYFRTEMKPKYAIPMREDVIKHVIKIRLGEGDKVMNKKKVTKIKVPLHVNSKFVPPKLVVFNLEKQKKTFFKKTQKFLMHVEHEDVLIFDQPFRIRITTECQGMEGKFKFFMVSIVMFKRRLMGVSEEDFDHSNIEPQFTFYPKDQDLGVTSEDFIITLPSGKYFPTVRSKYVQIYYKLQVRAYYTSKKGAFISKENEVRLYGKPPYTIKNFSPNADEHHIQRVDLSLL